MRNVIRRIHVVVTASRERHPYFWSDAGRLTELLESHGSEKFDAHAAPEIADAIVFVGSEDPAMADIRRHPLFRRFPSKSFAFHAGDEPLPTLPGIYASIPKRWHDPRVYRGGFYLRASLNGAINNAAGLPAKYLFSFIGAMDNHPVRGKLGSIRCDNALLIDSGRDQLPNDQAHERFVRSLRESSFVLCPRGGGTSSFRIFETMQAGRVPVIISDDWVEPSGPEWHDFAVRVREAELDAIPQRLSALQERAPEMGACARKAWEAWFSPKQAGATVVGWLNELRQSMENHGPFRMPWSMRARYSFRVAKGQLARFRNMDSMT